MGRKKRARRKQPPVRQPVRSPWSMVWHSPWLVATLVLALYALWLAVYVPRSHGGLDFLFIGQQFQHSHASSTIRIDPSYLATRDPTGYDGQFYYYIAADPLKARYYIDAPADRYTRILYPLAVRLLAVGQVSLIPYTLLLVNLLAIAGGTLALAFWLKRRGLSPWFALVYGLYPGQFIALTLDLTEPLAYALVALAVYLFDFGGRYRLVWAGISFALAGLTREVALIFAAIYGLALLLDSDTARPWQARLEANWRRAALLLAIAVLPLVLYKAFLGLWLGSTGVTDYSVLQVPFHGLFALLPWQSWHIKEIWGIIAPALILLAMGLWALWRRVRAVEIWVLLANIEVCVMGLTSASYDAFLAPARIAMGVALAALLCLPRFDSLTRRRYVWLNRSLWLAPCTVLWLLLALDWQGTMNRIYPV
jgi:hypothetical protein